MTYRTGLARLRSRREGRSPCDAAEIQRRFDELAGATFDDGDVFRAFSDVFDAVCAPEQTVFSPRRAECHLNTERRQIRIAGTVATQSGDKVAEIKRDLDFGSGLAHHALLVVRPEFRNLGLAAVLVLHSLAFYERAAIKEIRLTAGLTTGPYYWARLGFAFETPADAELVRAWAARVNGKLNLGVDCLTVQTAYQWSRFGLDEDVYLSLGQIAAVFPDDADRIGVRARDVGLALDQRVHFGKAMLLSGPSWRGRMVVSRVSRTLLENYLAGRVNRAGDVLLGPRSPS